MAKIQITVIDMAGNSNTLPLPDDKPLHELVASIVTLVDLPATDISGRPLYYRLFSRQLQRVLSSDGSLYSNGIVTDDQLRIVPAPSSQQVELELLTDPSPGARYILPHKQRITLGRGSSNDIVIQHPTVSRRHGEIIEQEGIHTYHDLNSANGSYINNQLVAEPMPIAPGSILSLGENIRLVYQETRVDVLAQQTQPLRPEVLAKETGSSQMRTGLTPMPRTNVFVSYDPAQMEITEKLVNQLRQANFHLFWDQEIPLGSNPTDVIAMNLKMADIMLIILSPDAVSNSKLTDQWAEFLYQQKPIVPILYEDAQIPNLISDFSVVAYKGSYNMLLRETVAALMTAAR